MNAPSSRASLLWLLGLALAVRVVATLVACQLGFRAVSDDDFARVAVAQTFAHAPRWDASGTSWLPAPFWLTGGAMTLLGRSYDVARGVAWATSLISVLGFVWCGRALGLRTWWLALASCCFSAMPHAVWLGIATVPEGYVAVLTVLGLCATSCAPHASTQRMRTLAWAGGLALLFATLSRYETWPAAAVACGYHMLALWRYGQRWRLPALILCLTGPAAWLLHGASNHGSAWFFVSRVSSYRAALGATPKDWLDVLGNYPKALVLDEPVLTLLVVAAAAAGSTRRKQASPATVAPAALQRWAPLVCGASAILAFLVWGDVTNGAPTHHPERTLLPCWLAALLVSTAVLQRHFSSAPGAPMLVCSAVSVVGFGFGLWSQLPGKQFVDRSAELTLGARLGPRLAPDVRLWVETPGYGYVAVSVGTQRPWLVDGFNPSDPRQLGSAPSFDDPRVLADYLHMRQVGLAVVPERRAPLFEGWARRESGFGSSLIFGVPPPGSTENSEQAPD